MPTGTVLAVEGGQSVRVLAVSSQKGGVGKSTTALYLATLAAGRLGGSAVRPVVGLIDRDESKNLTELLRIRPELLRPGVTLLAGDEIPAADSGLALVVIDTPPGVTAIRALHEADLIVVPVLPEEQGVANLPRYLRNIEAQRRAVNPDMRLLALLPTMVKPQTTLHRQLLPVIDAIAERNTPRLIVLPPIPDRTRIASYDLDAPEYAASAKELFKHVQLA